MTVPNMGLAWRNTLKQFGAGLAIQESPAVAISALFPTQILLNNPDRVFWIVQNVSPYYGVIAFNRLPTLTTGLVVAGLGGFVSAQVDEDGESVTYPVWALESVAGLTWYVLEVIAS